LSVVLRCGLVREHSVDLFAGAGIVAESRPEQELAETEWKLLTMQGALRLG
jgi:isochorismate synthase EntC